MSFLEALGDLVKAKYTSRKKVKGKWQYTYADDQSGKSGSSADDLTAEDKKAVESVRAADGLVKELRNSAMGEADEAAVDSKWGNKFGVHIENIDAAIRSNRSSGNGVRATKLLAAKDKLWRAWGEARTRSRANKIGKSMSHIDQLGALVKGFGNGDNRNDSKNDSTNNVPPGAKMNAPPGKPGANGDEKPNLAKPGDENAGGKKYATKVEGENGEFQFVYQAEGERDPEARFVVSGETSDGAHWELPHHSEHYDKFKQWKAAKKQGLHGTDIPQELVAGAMAHSEKHHYDAGPHKAAYDDHLAHQGGDQGPKVPPSHASQNGNGNGAPKGMQPKDAQQAKPGDDKGKAEQQGGPPNAGDKGPPQKGDGKDKPMVGKMQEDRVAPDDHTSGGIPRGKSRSGTEHATSGDVMEEAEDIYMKLYGEYRNESSSKMNYKSHIDDLGDLVKAKYISRKRNAKGGYDYTYASDKKKGKKKTKDVGAAVSAAQEAHRTTRNNVLLNRVPVGDLDETHQKLSQAYDDYQKKTGSRHQDDTQMLQLSDGAHNLRKGHGVYQFNLSGGAKVPIPDNLLFDYLCAFIEEAVEHERKEPEHRMAVAGEDVYESLGRPVMGELVMMIPHNPNLARAVKKFKVTVEGIVTIMRGKNMIKPDHDGATDHGDYWANDWDSSQSMGGGPRRGPLNDSLMASKGPTWAQPASDAVRPLQLATHEGVRFGGVPVQVGGTVERAGQAQLAHNQFAKSDDMRVVAADCVLHGIRDVSALNLEHLDIAECSCGE